MKKEVYIDIDSHMRTCMYEYGIWSFSVSYQFNNPLFFQIFVVIEIRGSHFSVITENEILLHYFLLAIKQKKQGKGKKKRKRSRAGSIFAASLPLSISQN